MDIFRQNGARAIWIDHEVLFNRYLRFQTEFEAKKGQNIKFYVCVETKFELYINGNLAHFGQYDDYPDKKIYECADVSAYIKDGKNLVSILAYSAAHVLSMHRAGLPMLIFTAVSDTGCVLSSDENVKCAPANEFISGKIEKISNERKFNFGFDLRGDDGWREKYVSQDWQNAVICDDSAICYLPRPIKSLVLEDINCGEIIAQGEFSYGEGDTMAKKMQFSAMSYRDAEEVLDTTNGVSLKKDNVYWVVDLGEETAGYMVLDIEAEEGAVLDIACGEHLIDLRVRSWVGERNYAFRCICRDGRQRIAFYIQRLAGRYLQLFAHSKIKKVYQAGLHKTWYPTEFESTLNLNDRLFNKIYDVSKRTLKLCMHDHYEDCPQREQALYAMDSRDQMIAGYYAFGETAMPKASLTLLAQGQKENGLLEQTAPSRFERTIPSFSLSWIFALKEYVLFSGDVDFAREMFPVAKRILKFFERHIEDGVLMRPQGYEFWNFYEWTDGMINWEDEPSKKTDAPLTGFLAIALKDYAELCSWIGEKDEEENAKKLHEEICSKFHSCFYCEKEQAYRTYLDDAEPHFAQLTQAVALLGGCVPEEFCDIIREKATDSNFVEASLSYTIFKYDALLQDGEKYISFVLDDIEKQWGHMLYNGATSFWETIVGANDFEGGASLCHGWSAVPIYVFWRYVLGVYPNAPGFEKVEASNNGLNIKADGLLKTPKGVYNVKTSETEAYVKKLD